jgi:hypothetical protein
VGESAEIDDIIADFCSQVIREPLCFFSEADLQGLLFAKLLDRFPRQFDTGVKRGPVSKGRYRTGRVHREYGAGERHRMDIVIFPVEKIPAIDSPNLQVGRKYLQPVVGIELGTEKTKDSKAHLKNDVKKLKNVSKRGYLIHFFRDTTSADVGTKSREETEKKIRRILRVPFESHHLKPAERARIKVLCFVLRLSRRHRKIWGKCEVFDPHNKVWMKVNLRRAREEIRILLRKQ